MLYVHIPFCHHKCTYCAFYSVASRRGREAYVDALCSELYVRRTSKPLRTIYFGGGTPSHLDLSLLHRVVQTIRGHYDLSQLEEATLEANPEDLTEDYLKTLASWHFFNRISIGIQSFDDDQLHLLNRVHTGSQAREAVLRAAAWGFDNLSIDLIMGLPGQSLRCWENNLDVVASLPMVKHLSCYELTVEPGTILERQLQTGRVSLADEQTVVAQYQTLQQWLAPAGFEQYEVSNYCRPGWHSRHNSRYWDRTPYIGVGAAAHSFDGCRRRWNVADVERYSAVVGQVPYESETLSSKDAYNEYIMTALRTVVGIKKKEIPIEFREYLAQAVRPFLIENLLTETETAYRPTPQGLLHADGIAASLFVE